MSQTKVKVRREKYGRRSVIKPTTEEIAAFAPSTRDEMDIPNTIAMMQLAIAAEGAHVGVPGDGKGMVIISRDGDHGYVCGGKDDGLLTTDDLVLVFDDIVAVLEGSRDRTPYVDPTRTDLCPNIRHVRLADYSL